MKNALTIHTDGGARGNPGPAAIGVFIEKEGRVIQAFGKKIGETTNNVAEYTAVIEALRYIKKLQKNNDTIIDNKLELQVDFFLDSKLVVEQLNGTFKIKSPKLRELFLEIKTLEQEVGGIILYRAVPREYNKEADFLVNQAFD